VSDHRLGGWPAFELVTLGVASGLPSEAQILATRGVPRRIIGHEFTALSEAYLVAAESGQNLIAFGSSGLRGIVCLDPASGAVVHVPNPDGPQRNPVNTSIDMFTECVAAMIERFPFYGDDDESDLWESVADELAETLEGIDEATGAHNCFWVTFVDDVRMGDYATALIVDG
jgi:hypothetical protein